MQRFDENPILNSPYSEPERHWHLNDEGKPTGTIGAGRRPSRHFVPIPKAERERRQERSTAQSGNVLDEVQKDNPIVNEIRRQVNAWRLAPPEKWNVTYATQRLLQLWRSDKAVLRPFFCQIEAAETLIWLNEVAPHTAAGRHFLSEIRQANEEANPGLLRYACKMATGAGKTMVMAMLIAYHAINNSKTPRSSRFCSNFLIITPGITVKDRLRVLLPSDPENYYKRNGIIPTEFYEDIGRARILITNFHALRQRELLKISKAKRDVIAGNDATNLSMVETEGQMLERVCKELMQSNEAIVINDEAHHCYRHKSETSDLRANRRQSSEEKKEASRNNEVGRIWIRGIEALSRKVGVKACYDLSATPYFLNGSGYSEGHLFPWVVSDYDLLEAMESGIVKLPRVPIDDNSVTSDNLPMFRNLYQHVSKNLPRKGRTAQGKLNLATHPLPAPLTAAMSALYDQYAKTHDAWIASGIDIPPVFAIVCNNTSTSKLMHDYVAGYELPNRAGIWRRGEFRLFSNVGADGKPLARMKTLLIDSEQLDSGEAMSKEFKEAASAEIELYKREMRLRFPDWDAKKLSDEDLLREIMNTVGKKGRLGEQIRCVISVSMLTEGWDTNNVTHILGVRAFGTQLLCEQVVGRGLRRYAYHLGADGLLQPEYADVFGVPFTFANGSKVAEPHTPPPQYRVWAMDDREKLAIFFPRVRGYTVKLPDERLVAKFDTDSRLTLTPEDAPSLTKHRGIVGKGLDITFESLKQRRMNELVFCLARETAQKFADDDGNIPPSRFRDLVPITRRWLDECLTCIGETLPQYLLWKMLAVKASERIFRSCIPIRPGQGAVFPLIDKFNPEGSSFGVDFQTTKELRHETHADKCHINLAVCDSDWEISFCRILEQNPTVNAYVRNDHLGFEVPYEYQKREHIYLPDFIVLLDDGRGSSDLLSLIVEIKGLRDDKDQVKADTMNKLWIPAINNDGRWGRWAFEEILDMNQARETLAGYASGNQMAASI